MSEPVANAGRSFQKVETQVDFPLLELDILKFWDRIDAFEKLRRKNAGKPRWSFLDGPITANNPMGVHHAWGRAYKDVYNRYFAATGHDLRYQNGFDCQGLWVEVEVEKELKLQSKRDIENLVPGDREASIDRFVKLCKARVDKFARVQTDQTIRLGNWMEWDRTDADWAKPVDDRKSYFTMSNENNYTIWAFLKKCHSKGLIYRGYDVMPWCGRCGVGISEQEMKDGYRMTEHRSAFVKLPLLDRPGENLLVWTTTPWTLTSNVGAAVNPELTYLQVKLKGEIYYVAKGTFKLNRMESSGDEDGEAEAGSKGKKKKDWIDGVPHLKSIEQLFKEKAGKDKYEIVGEVRGQEMLGWRYAGPFDDLPAQQAEYGYPAEVARVVKDRGWCPATTAVAAHRVISGGKDVSEAEGTGIVHTAPGCGQIDFQWGKENGLPPVAPIGDDGVFHTGFGNLTGKNAADPATAETVFEELKKKDRLFATEGYVHRYPHCWRCKQELLYRLVDEWFINMGPRNTEEGFRGQIMEVVKQVNFLPESLNGKARERDWLWNMGDWMISKKRYWGLALPIWVDDKTGDFEVIGSREELKERAVEGWDEFEGHSPHRPNVDKVKIRSRTTGNLMSRVPDVGNPWLDAGIVGFSTLKFSSDPAYWEKWYPADFITESFPGQFRNWFYALLALSTMMSDGKLPFRNVFGFATMRDQTGKEMHKSEGNSIEFISAAHEGFKLVHKLKANEKSAKPEGAISFVEVEFFDKEQGKNVKAIEATYPPIGADVMRWLFCRHNPVANLNFGPVPANEIRAKFILKWWNTYAFFCNYARLDGFDPTAPQVPVKDRPDIDRWILSDLQELVRIARQAFEAYDVRTFCLATESFVDDKLSNWYVRRNRRRFWKSESGSDKTSAYQTLYEVLKTLCVVCGPVVPFVSEVMFQNLRKNSEPESVHHCDYPGVNETLVDAELSADTNSLLTLITMGSAARKQAKIRTRQPLAELMIQSLDESERRAVHRFPEQIMEELNLKSVSLVDDPAAQLLKVEVKLNMKVAGAKWGPRLKEAQQFLATADAAEVERQLRARTLEIAGLKVEPDDLTISYKAEDGWIGIAEKGTQVKLDIRLTEELELEGLAREIVRSIQDLRKESGLEMEDRIELCLETKADKLDHAIHVHRETIASETLTVAWAEVPSGGGWTSIDVVIEGHALKISLRKATNPV